MNATDQTMVDLLLGAESRMRPERWPNYQQYRKAYGELIFQVWPEIGRRGFCRVCQKPLKTKRFGCCTPSAEDKADGYGYSACQLAYSGRFGLGMHWLKRQVIARNGHYACERCGEVQEEIGFPNPRMLEIHHRDGRQGERMHRLDNLEALCRRCHRQAHRKEPMESEALFP